MDDRIFGFILGSIFGFIVGYLVKSRRELKDELSHVRGDDSDTGEVTAGLINKIALFAVVILVAVSAFYSQHASNNVSDGLAKDKKIGSCNRQYLSKTIAALNARTQYSKAQSDANVQLQKAQLVYLTTVAMTPPNEQTKREAALSSYVKSLNTYIDVSAKTSSVITGNDYPTTADLNTCLSEK